MLHNTEAVAKNTHTDTTRVLSRIILLYTEAIIKKHTQTHTTTIWGWLDHIAVAIKKKKKTLCILHAPTHSRNTNVFTALITRNV